MEGRNLLLWNEESCCQYGISDIPVLTAAVGKLLGKGSNEIITREFNQVSKCLIH